ncbi:protein MNN4-like [Cucumis melo var. makuwa]|uniref:Protein MNN4-like n=1 Tax=Cucumis melo var. makuwa TaxID=1194695 RepID=A0A5A7TBR6_CUCMM|nr:protein MNN4-like [Cucumis melo var. makuwa]
MKGREELLSKVDKVPVPAENSKGKEKVKTFEEYYEEVEKEIEKLSPLEDEVPNPKKKRKVTMKKKTLKEQFKKSTISMERIMLLYCIMMEILVNVGEIICEHVTAWVKHPHGSKFFPCLIEQLCIKACLELEKSLQVQESDGVCSRPTLHRVITIHKNKAKLRHLKTKQEGEKETSESKDAKTSNARDSKETLPLASSRSSAKKKSTNPLSPIKCKLSKATTSQIPTKSKTPTKPQACPQSQKSKTTKSKSPPLINDLTTTSSPRHETDKDRALVLFESIKTSFLHQEKTPQPLDAIPINQTKLPSPKTSNQDVFHETSFDPTTLLDEATRESEEGEKEKEVLKKATDDPL